MLIEIAFVIFILSVALNTIYSVKFNYHNNGVKSLDADLNISLNKNISKFLNIIGA